MKVPILILTNNRPTMLSDMITSIESYTDPETYKIIICDNNSQQKEMLELLDTLEKTYTVIRNDTNNTFEGLNPGLKIVKNFHDKYFIISDPDIILNSNIPSNWVTKMCELLDKTNYPKVGLSLNISFENINNWTNFIITTEKRYWKKECKVNFEFLEADCYEALVDTTMAMYRHDTFTYWTNEVLQFDRDHGIVGGGWIHLGDFNPKYKDKLDNLKPLDLLLETKPCPDCGGCCDFYGNYIGAPPCKC